MVDTLEDHRTENDFARQAVGVFGNADLLEAAVDELEISGFNRAAISVLASDKTVKDRLGRLYRSVAEIMDDPRAPLTAFTSRDSRVGGEAAVVGAPLFIGGITGGSLSSLPEARLPRPSPRRLPSALSGRESAACWRA